MLAPFLAAALLGMSAPRPAWISTLPEVPGRVYGLGAAQVSGSQALALRQAQDGAKADVLARLRVTLKADTRIRTEFREERQPGGNPPTASRSIQASTDVAIRTQAADLPGLKIESTYLEEGDHPTLYALGSLDLAVATQEVEARYKAALGRLGSDPGAGLRGKLHRSQVLKKADQALAKLEELFALLRVGGADPALGDSLQAARLKVEQERVDMRTSLTFGMPLDPGASVDAQVRDVVRTVFLGEGLGWSDSHPDLSVRLRVKADQHGVQTGSRWWDTTRSAAFVLAQGTLSLTLVDAAGQEYESTLVVAKGVGATEFQAETLLLQDYKAKVGKAVAAWLAELGRAGESL